LGRNVTVTNNVTALWIVYLLAVPATATLHQFWKMKPMIYGGTQEFRHVLNDAALFLLCKFFRRLFLEDLVETLGDTKEWRALLQKESA
jgi:hypothetical protein